MNKQLINNENNVEEKAHYRYYQYYKRQMSN